MLVFSALPPSSSLGAIARAFAHYWGGLLFDGIVNGHLLYGQWALKNPGWIKGRRL